MKKYLFFLLLFLASCSNIDKKEHYYNNSIRINVIFNKNLETFERGYLKISLFSKEQELIETRYIYDINHKYGYTNNKKLLVNFRNYEKGNGYYTLVELFVDIKNNGVYENYKGILRENTRGKELIYDVK